MKKLNITESERKQILRQHTTLLKEELSSSDMLKKIQRAIGAKDIDAIIGPDTTAKLLTILKNGTTEPQKTFDFSCVKNHNHREVITYDWRMARPDYQLGDLLFQDDGTYFDLDEPNTPLKYTCSGDMIKTSNHGDIQKEQNLFNTITEPIKPLVPIQVDTITTSQNEPTNVEDFPELRQRQKIERQELKNKMKEEKKKRREEIAALRKQTKEKIKQLKK